MAPSPILLGYSLVGVYPCAVWKPRRVGTSTTASVPAVDTSTSPCISHVSAQLQPARCNTAVANTADNQQHINLGQQQRPGAETAAAPIRATRLTSALRTAPYSQPNTAITTVTTTTTTAQIQEPYQPIHRPTTQQQPNLDDTCRCHSPPSVAAACPLPLSSQKDQCTSKEHSQSHCPSQSHSHSHSHSHNHSHSCSQEARTTSQAPQPAPAAQVVGPVPVAIAATPATPMLFVPISVANFIPPMTGTIIQKSTNYNSTGTIGTTTTKVNKNIM